MPDYQEMYRKMILASEAAINILIEAQRECEEMYINAPEPKIGIFPGTGTAKDTSKDK